MRQFLLFILVLVTVSCSRSDCKILRNGKFTYGGNLKDVVTVTFTGDKQREQHENGKYFIDSDVHWTNDCEYITIIKDFNLPGFPHSPGDTLKVKIDKVDGNVVRYSATIKDTGWSGLMTKVE